MNKTYRVCFFQEDMAHADAVLVLHFASDSAAREESLQILSASALARVELWEGTRKVFQSNFLPAASRLPPAPSTCRQPAMKTSAARTFSHAHHHHHLMGGL